MKKEETNIFTKDVDIPEIVQKKAALAFAKIKTEGETMTEMKKKKSKEDSKNTRGKRFKHPAAAILCICMLGAAGITAAAAAAYHHWSRGMQGALQADEARQQELIDEGLATVLKEAPDYDSMAVTQNGITIRPLEIIVDKYFAYLSFSVEGFALPDGKEPGFDFVDAYLGDDPNSPDSFLNTNSSFFNGIVSDSLAKPVYLDGSPLEFTESGGIKDRFVNEEGHLEYVIIAHSPVDKSLLGETVHVEFTNLGTLYKAGFSSVADGKWAFNLPLTGKDSSVSYPLSYPLGESGAVVDSLELSPISAKINYLFQGEYFEVEALDSEGNPVSTKLPSEPPAFCGFKLKDGTLLPYIAEGGKHGYTDDSLREYHSLSTFDRVIDVDEVEAALFRKTSPGGGAAPTEENFYVVPLS